MWRKNSVQDDNNEDEEKNIVFKPEQTEMEEEDEEEEKEEESNLCIVIEHRSPSQALKCDWREKREDCWMEKYNDLVRLRVLDFGL